MGGGFGGFGGNNGGNRIRPNATYTSNIQMPNGGNMPPDFNGEMPEGFDPSDMFGGEMPEDFDGNMPGGFSRPDESSDSDEQKTTDSNFNRPFMDRFPSMNDNSSINNTAALILLGISAGVLIIGIAFVVKFKR